MGPYLTENIVVMSKKKSNSGRQVCAYFSRRPYVSRDKRMSFTGSKEGYCLHPCEEVYCVFTSKEI